MKKYIIPTIIVLTCLIAILPMGLSPEWNGENIYHRNQYELLADAILDGHIYIDYQDIDEKLLEMDNPYDPVARVELGVKYHWDHAFYKGKYYVYFGIAPVIFTFLPYKIITGTSLTTYHSTQIFSALFIIGVFALFYRIYKYFDCKIRFGVYLLSSSALSLLSLWTCVDKTALYCTAIASGLCMAVWSIYFYFKAVYGDYSLKRAIIYATIGGLFGALTFACRPPIGFVNILAIPFLITFLHKYGINKKVIMHVLIVLIPSVNEVS